MRGMIVVVLLVGCLGGKKAAMAPAAAEPVSKLEQASRIEDEDLNAPVAEEAVNWQDISATGSSHSAGQSTPPPPQAAAQPLDSAEPKQPEKLVIEAWLTLASENVGATVDAIHAKIVASGGRIVSETVNGSGASAVFASLEFRVPPTQTMGVLAWLDSVAVVRSKRVQASDVSKTLFDQELALKNLELTMERLQKLAAQSGPIADLLTIEKEMTRVRGEIERIKGEQRWLLDRVELATITVSINRIGDDPIDDEEVPEPRVYPGPQLAMLTLFDPGMRQRTRVGGGATIRLQRYATFELDVFPRSDDAMDTRTVLATFGTALYSSYLRDGRRRYLNPYIGVRVGYGYLGGNGSPVIAGELGVELFKHKYLLVDGSVRALAFITSHVDAALHATLGASVPF